MQQERTTFVHIGKHADSLVRASLTRRLNAELAKSSCKTASELRSAQGAMSARAARNARRTTLRRAGAVVLALSFLGVTVFGLSGCEFVYLPECDNDCTAGGGNDTYGKATP